MRKICKLKGLLEKEAQCVEIVHLVLVPVILHMLAMYKAWKKPGTSDQVDLLSEEKESITAARDNTRAMS